MPQDIQTSSISKRTIKKAAARILIVDPQTLVRSALRAFLNTSSNFQIVSEASNVDEAIYVLRNNQNIDLIITEAQLPGKSALELLYEMKRLSINIPSLILGAECTPSFTKQAIVAGIKGIVLKNSSIDVLERGLTAVQNGDIYFCPEIQPIANSLELQIKREVIPIETDPLSPLSPREREIFHLLANGMQNSAIAKQLFISPRTVETHRARVVRKLGLHSNAELIRYAIKNGLSSL